VIQQVVQMKSDYKEARAAIEDLKAGDDRGIEPAIHFLKADADQFGSGYLKEYLWRYLSRVQLTVRQRQRLLQVAGKYLERQLTREFWQMCRFVRHIADAEFAEYVKGVSESAQDDDVRQRATLLAAYLEGLEEGEKERRRINRKVRYGEREVTSREA
jgi:hypothetical protein